MRAMLEHAIDVGSLRIGRGVRAVAYREGEWLRLLTLDPDHDAA